MDRYPIAMAFLAAFAAGAARAGPLLIAPTTVEFAPERRSAAIEITNQSDEPVDLQFRAFAWIQQDGGDRLAATDELAISPPIATLAPHRKQVFRVLDVQEREARAGAAEERSYRLLLNELPRTTGSSIRINVEFSLPVFITPRGAVAHAAPAVGPAGIRIANDGRRRLRLSGLAIRSPDGTSIDVGAAATYLLAGTVRVFPLPPAARVPAGARLVGSSDAGPIDEPLSALAAR